MRVAADTVQLVLPDVAPGRAEQRWWSLPERTRAEVLTLLARLLARGVLIETSNATDDEGDDDE